MKSNMPSSVYTIVQIIIHKSNLKQASKLSLWGSLMLFLTACPDATNPPQMGGDMAGEMMEDIAGEIAGALAGMDAGEVAGETGGITSGLRQLGDPCTSVAQCESGICFSEGVDEDGICTSSCDSEESECPLEGFGCRSTTSFGYICIPIAPQAPCSPCTESYECGNTEDYCIFFPDEGANFCTQGCEEDSECPAGHTCTFMGGDTNQCFPDNGLNQCNVVDSDQDGIADGEDNCPNTSNPEQTDTDNDGIGDDCDLCVETADPQQVDSDGDGYGDACDNCPMIADPTVLDSDEDGYGNVCDNCPETFNPDQIDSDNDGSGDLCTPLEEINFTIGSFVGATSTSSSPEYTLIGGMIGPQRPGVLTGPNYQLRAYP